MNQKDESFKDFVLDQLRGLDDVEARRMFGGYGLYQDETFFGIIHKDRVYFKIDDSTVSEYRKRKMKPFRPNAKQTLKSLLPSAAGNSRRCRAARRVGRASDFLPEEDSQFDAEEKVMSDSLTGGCQFGAVRYEFSGEPLFCGNGHCRDCRRASDGAY